MHTAIDTETTGLDRHHGCRPFMVGMSDDQGNRLYWQWDVNPKTRSVRVLGKHIRQIRTKIRKTNRLIFHNAKFDVGMLLHADIISKQQAYSILEKCHDTSIMLHTLRSDGNIRLEDASIYYCDLYDDNTEALHKIAQEARKIAQAHNIPVARKGLASLPSMVGDEDSKWWMADYWLMRYLAKRKLVPTDQLSKYLTACRDYCLDDTDKTLALYFRLYTIFQHPQNKPLWKVYLRRRANLAPTFEMEEEGMDVCPKRYDFLVSRDTENLEALKTELNDFGLKNPNSPKQVQAVAKTLKIKSSYKTATGQPSFNATAISDLIGDWPSDTKQGRFLRLFQAYSQQAATLGYLHSYQRFIVNNKLHPSYKIPGTATTRMASFKPSGQQWGKHKDEEGFNNRYIVGPREGYAYVSIDYSNIELRIFAFSSGDKELIRCYETGKKAHLVFAQKIYPEEFSDVFEKSYPDLYSRVKAGDFSIIYGASERRADKTYGKHGAYKAVREGMPEVDNFLNKKHQEAQRNGHIMTLGGSRLYVDIGAPHKAVNYFCQGSAGDALLIAIPHAWPYIKAIGGKLIAAIHDQIIFKIKEDQLYNREAMGKIKKAMEVPGKIFGFPTPVDITIIPENWSEEIDYEEALSL